VKKVSLYRASRDAACFFLRCHLLPVLSSVPFSYSKLYNARF